jgi:hypothetical protein
VLGEDVADRRAVRVLQALDRTRIQGGRRRAAEQAAAEASALLVGEVDQGDGVARRSAAAARSTSRAAMTPWAPSSQPPFGTDSTCEPTASAPSRSPRSVAQRLPASSSSTATLSIAPSRSRRNARARCHSPVQHTRPAPSGSPVSRSSSRRSATLASDPRLSGDACSLHATRSRRIACIRQCAPPPPSVNADSSGS